MSTLKIIVQTIWGLVIAAYGIAMFWSADYLAGIACIGVANTFFILNQLDRKEL